MKGTNSIVKYILIAIMFGIAVGLILGPQASVLGVFGKVFLQLIKAFAIPLVFFAIIEAVISTSISLKQTRNLFIIVAVNSIAAATIGLSLSNIFRPGEHLKDVLIAKGQSVSLENFSPKALTLNDVLNTYVPSSVIQPFIEGNVIAVVLLAVLLGVGIRITVNNNEADSQLILKITNLLLGAWRHILVLLTSLVPLAVFAVIAKIIGQYGFEPFIGLVWYVLVGFFGLALHACIVYPIWILSIAKITLRQFLAAVRAPITFAFGVNSSLTTLPLTLHALDELKVDKSSSRLGACVATNFNNDGIILYEAMAVLFIAQAYGIELSFAEQLLSVGLCMVAAIGVAGVPEAGVISLSLVLATVGLPLEFLPLLLSVDWLIARCRSVVNVLADMTVSVSLDGMRTNSSASGGSS